MAASKVPQSCSLGIKVQTGTNAAGSAVYKTFNFSNVKVDATDQDVYDVAIGIGSLQTYPVSAVTRLDHANIINQ
ncbi:MAG: DUF1659 domain-containing protein [Pelosinus sp.]|nr:DUF1659 domain-containing protein [Pelosinus sp.]